MQHHQCREQPITLSSYPPSHSWKQLLELASQGDALRNRVHRTDRDPSTIDERLLQRYLHIQIMGDERPGVGGLVDQLRD